MANTDICRLCAESHAMYELTPLDAASQHIISKVYRCCQIDLSLDNSFPKRVCNDCVCRLEQCWTFAQAVAAAQDKLRAQVSEDPLADIMNAAHDGADCLFGNIDETNENVDGMQQLDLLSNFKIKR